jgi:hypothetical protein
MHPEHSAQRTVHLAACGQGHGDRYGRPLAGGYAQPVGRNVCERVDDVSATSKREVGSRSLLDLDMRSRKWPHVGEQAELTAR